MSIGKVNYGLLLIVHRIAPVIMIVAVGIAVYSAEPGDYHEI